MNLRCVHTVKDSGVWSAIKPVPSWSRPPSENVFSARVSGVFTAGSPGGQNPKGSTINQGSSLLTAGASAAMGTGLFSGDRP